MRSRLIVPIVLVLFVHNCHALHRYGNRFEQQQQTSFDEQDVQSMEPADAPMENNQTANDNIQVLSNPAQAQDDNNIVSNDNTCEIELSIVGGSCNVNNNKIKPTILLSYGGKRKSRQDKKRFWENRGDWTTIGNANSGAKPQQRQQHQLDNDAQLRKRVVKEFVHRFLELMKRDYGPQLEPLKIDDVQFIKLKHFGKANIYGLEIFGFKDIDVLDTSLVTTSRDQNEDAWKFNAQMMVANLTIAFKVNANFNEKLFINKWHLKMFIERCLFSSSFVLDFTRQRLSINSFFIKSFDNFRLAAHEPLTYPFNEVISGLVNKEKYYLKHVIELNVQKYINLTIDRRLNLKSLLDRIMKRDQ